MAASAIVNLVNMSVRVVEFLMRLAFPCPLQLNENNFNSLQTNRILFAAPHNCSSNFDVYLFLFLHLFTVLRT